MIINNVTNIAMLGSTFTTVRFESVGDGEEAKVTEPSTIIDCQGCPTGFQFTNIFELTVKRITFSRCGGNIMVNYTSSRSLNTNVSLALVAVQNLTLDIVSFRNPTGKHSLIALNIIGKSVIRDISVLQNVLHTLPGTILLAYANSQIPDGAKLDSVLNVGVITYIKNVTKTLGLPYMKIELFSCRLNIRLLIMHVTMHSIMTNEVIYTNDLTAAIEFQASKDAAGYQVDMQHIRISATQDLYTKYSCIFIYLDGLGYCPSSFSTTAMPIGALKVTDLKAFQYDGVIIYQSSISSQFMDNLLLNIFFNKCELPNILMHTLKSCSVIIHNSTIGVKHSIITRNQQGLAIADRVPRLEIGHCNFLHNWIGPGFHLKNSYVHFSGNSTFYNNTAKYGAGMLIEGSRSRIYLSPHTTLNFIKNTAIVTGGGLHIQSDKEYHPMFYECQYRPCIFQLQWKNYSAWNTKSYAEKYNIHLLFNSNSAAIAGSAVWGGSLKEYCNQIDCDFNSFGTSVLFGQCSSHCLTNDIDLFVIDDYGSRTSDISSSPQNLCYCNNELECTSFAFKNLHGPSFSLYPGQSLQIDIAAVGQENGLVSALVQAKLSYVLGINAHLGNLQRTQRIRQAACEKLVYNIFSSMVNIDVELYIFLAHTLDHESVVLNYGAPAINRSIFSSVSIKQCPVGFQHNKSIGTCTCFQPLLRYISTNSCDINTQTVQRTPSLWIDAYINAKGIQVLAAHQHCPFDYCDSSNFKLNLSTSDEQCANNRSGILCGGCKKGLSLTMGSPKCTKCSSYYLFLFLVFPVAGLFLVIIITCLNLTVSIGTSNALILYANIIQGIRSTFFPSTNVLSVFIAWLNLDLGIDLCFYDGMDFYALTWLQFLFPIYIWFLVIIMIITSHYSSTVAKLISRDAVKVLATLFLMSYTKLFQTIIIVFSFTYINYENSNEVAYQKAVWLYDGNVEFASGKHIPLLLVAIAFGLFYIVPFTLLLSLAPLLQKISHHYKALRWVNKLMPFLDAYQGPYNSRYRVWSGLMLIARFVLFISFAVTSIADPQIKLKLIISFVTAILSLHLLLGIAFKSNILYKKPFINYLDLFYLANLGVLSTWSLIETNNSKSSKEAQIIVSSISVGLGLLMFICIVAYHAYLRLIGIAYVQQWWQKIMRKQLRQEGEHAAHSPSPEPPTQPTKTIAFIQLREPLLTDS